MVDLALPLAATTRMIFISCRIMWGNVELFISQTVVHELNTVVIVRISFTST